MSQRKTIPLELYRQVVEAVNYRDNNTFLSLLLTSPCFRAEAERVLYRSVHFCTLLVQELQSQRLFFRTVIDCPRLARLVIEYECIFHSPIEDSDLFWKLLSAALRSLVNLKELQFTSFGEPPMAHFLRECTFQLVSLYWGGLSIGIELSKFLAGQEALETLDIVAWNEKCPGPPASALRKLTRVIGNYGAILAFLPGRNVTQLAWQAHPGDSHPHIPAISSALRNLRELVFGYDCRRPPLSTFVDHLPNLEFLQLIGLHDTDILNIHRLPRLVGLSISHRNSLAPILPESHRHVVSALYSQSTTLRFIDIAVGGLEPENIDEYQRWYRNSREPVNIYRTPLFWGDDTWEEYEDGQ